MANSNQWGDVSDYFFHRMNYLQDPSLYTTTGDGESKSVNIQDQYNMGAYNPMNPGADGWSDPAYKKWVMDKYLANNGMTPEQWHQQFGEGLMNFNPATNQVQTDFVEQRDIGGELVMAALMAGVGGLAATGAGIGGGAAAASGGAGAGTAAIEAGALAGAPGYGAALEGSLAGIAGTGAGALDAPWGVNQQGPFIGDELIPPTLGEVNAVYPAGVGGLPPIPPTPPSGNSPNDIIENQGNVTGGGALNSNYTSGQIESALGLPAGSLSGLSTAVGSGGSALGRLLSGAGTASDLASVLGHAGSAAFGVIGSKEYADALRGIADQARTDRAPFLNKSLEWLNNPQSYQDGPGKSAMDATLRGLSVQGNPFGNPFSMAMAGDIANRNWQNAVTGFGNLGLAGQDSRSNLLAGAAKADSGAYDAVGYGLENIFNPKKNATDLASQLKQWGLT